MADAGPRAAPAAAAGTHNNSVWANSIVTITNARKRHRQLDHVVAGTGAGFISTGCLHPLDVVKTRFQAYEGRTGLRAADKPMYRTTFAALRHILETEGAKGVYRGLSPALVGSGVAWGVYFGIYENAKMRYLRSFENNNQMQTNAATAAAGKHTKLPTMYHLASGMEAGVICVLLTNPIWLIKTRLQLQGANASPYRGMFHAASCIIREEGPLAL
jgi:solute carrier family 25 folate transporter 32